MEEGEEHRYYNTNSLLFVANLTSLNPLIEFTLSVIVLFCSGYFFLGGGLNILTDCGVS